MKADPPLQSQNSKQIEYANSCARMLLKFDEESVKRVICLSDVKKKDLFNIAEGESPKKTLPLRVRLQRPVLHGAHC